MKGRRIWTWILCAALLVLLLAGCGGGRDLSPEETALCGRWAYSHEPDTAVLTLKKDGSAVYEKTGYTFSSDGTFLQLENGKGDPLLLRYVLEDGEMTLYIPSEYRCEGTPEGLVGLWQCEPKNWSYEFSAEGTFREDGVFTGRYTADEENGTITLQYPDYFEDTVCHYTLEGDSLTVEYPWHMVPMG